MSSLHVLDGLGNDFYLLGTASGTSNDPFYPVHSLIAGTQVGISGIPTVQFSGTQTVKSIIDSGAATVGISGTPNVQFSTAQPILSRPETSNGLSTYRVTWLGNSTGISIKSAPGQLYGYYFYNRGAVENFVKLYNQSSAPTVGTNVPYNVFALPPSGGCNMPINPIGVAFSGGIGIGVTTGLLDSATGAPASGDVIINLWYY